MAVYRVGRQRTYRGHPPGSTFEARLDPAAERRAVSRGDIRVVDSQPPNLKPGSYELPARWLSQHNQEV